ncbi:MAG TPA: DUF1588 domain-containing protein [Kofleriaceae bacterium]|nr:DUF1588 domain-containing protein [Kofleriaceae bacterium]
MRRLLPAVCVFIASQAGCAPGAPAPPAPAGVSGRQPVRVRRLSIREYTRAVSQLVGIEVSPHRFLLDSLDTEYDNGPVALSVQEEQAETYELLAWELASATVKNARRRLIGGCEHHASGAEACKRAFFDGFAARAFRRPLEPVERERYGALWDEAAAGGLDEALLTVTAALLQAPGFLYRSEIGGAREAGAVTTQLRPDEIASGLSFFLTGLPPDAELRAAAAAGALSTPAERRRQAERLIASPPAREHLRHFLSSWMGTWRLDTIVKSALYTALGPLRVPMIVELDRFYEHVLFDGDERSLADLFVTPVSFVDGPLAAHYGVALPPDALTSRVVLAPETRGGILTRAGFLTVHSGFDNSNPIARGVFVRGSILCAPPPAPPAGIPRVPPGTIEARTTRERYAEHTSNPFCQNCHAAIDGVGFGFEAFDGLGRHRVEENGHPIDASGRLLGTGDVDGPFTGVTELSNKLTESRAVTACFVRQLYRFALGASERPEDDGVIVAIADRADAHTPITELAVRLAESPLFVERAVQP